MYSSWIIENRFPDNTILNEEFSVGYDGKLRYLPNVRVSIYKNMTSWIKRHSGKVPVYLCMEEKPIHFECCFCKTQ